MASGKDQETLRRTPTQSPRWRWHRVDGSLSRRGTTSGSSTGSAAIPGFASAPRLKVHEKTGFFVAYSPDGKQVASGGSALKLLDVAGNRVSATVELPTDRVICGAFSPDGLTLATGGYEKDPAVRLRDVASGSERLVLQGGDRFVFRVAFTPDGQTLAAACNAGLVRLWDPKTGGAQGTIRFDATLFMTLAIAPDGKTLAVGTAAGAGLCIADIATRKIVAHFPAHEMEIRSIAFSPDGTLLATASNDHQAKLWDVSTQSQPP